MINKWKWFLVIMLVCFLAACVITCICLRHEKVPSDNTQQLLERIDSLNLEVDKLRNQNTQLVTEIDSSETRVQVIEKWYEKESDIIFNQPTDSDIVFFTKYISQDDR